MMSLHSKKTYVKPLCENDFSYLQRKATPTIHPFNKENSNPNALNTMDENKQNQILKMDAAYSGLLSSIEELQKWKAKVELEDRQKNKKVESLLQTIETQKKKNLDLQIQNENLNLQFTEEIQQRSLVTEKLYSTVEMCSALKKHISTLQGHFECREQIESLISAADKKRLQEVDDLRCKLDKLSIDHSDKVEYLTNSLGLETNKVLDLREKYEQQLNEVENEKDALCTIIKNYEREIASLSGMLEEGKAKARIYEKEKNDMGCTIYQLENAKETYALLLKEKEEDLKKFEISKNDLEKQIIFERSKVTDCQGKYNELLETSEIWKVESEKNILDLKILLQESNEKTSELEKRLDKEQNSHQEILCSLEKVKKEKSLLDIQIEESLSKIERFENLKKEFKMLEEANTLLLQEKDKLSALLENIDKDLISCKAENEQLSLLYAEKSKLLSNLKEESEKQLNNEADKIISKQSDYDLLLATFKALEKDFQEKSQIIINKEENITKLQCEVNDKENIIEVLQKENMEIRSNLEFEKEKIKTCTKCEDFLIKVAENEALKVELEKIKGEITNKEKSIMDVLLLLQETEATFNNDRLAKEKEIASYKREIRSLELENNCLKCDNEEFEKLKLLKKELNEEIEKLNIKILEHIEREKQLENKLQKKCINQKTEFENKKIEQDHIFENAMQEKNIKQKTDLEAKKNSLSELKMVMDSQDSDVSDSVQNEKPATNKHDKKWEMDSSSSDCLELVYDKENENQVRLVQKPRFNLQKNEDAKQMSFQTKRKREIKKLSQEETVRAKLGLSPRKRDGNPQFGFQHRNKELSFSDLNKKKQNSSEVTPPSEKLFPFNKKRVFFKKSLEERKSNFKSPKPWF